MKPNLFIVGAPKCGTTALHRYLEQHPQVFMTRQKELGYWQHVVGEPWRHHRSHRQIRELDGYLSRFKPAHRRGILIAGESTPAYMHTPGVAQAIYDFTPEAKIIIGIRDPIERAYSAWRMAVRNGQENRSFDEAIFLSKDLRELDYTRRSLYADAIEEWQDIFGRDRVHVYHQEHLRDHTQQTLRQVCRFLEVDPEGAMLIDTGQEHNKGLDYRHPFFKTLSQHPASTALARAILPGRARQFINERILAKPQALPRPSREAVLELEDFFEADRWRVPEVLS